MSTLLSIIIPFKDKFELTSKCMKSLYKYTNYLNLDYEVLLINNNSKKDIIKNLSRIINSKNTKIYNYNDKFNFHKLNNWAVKKSKGDILLFLNNDIEFVDGSGKLIEFMLKKSQKRDIGAVGPLLLYGDKETIQHAGVYLKAGGFADHIFIKQKLKEVMNNKLIPKKYLPIKDRFVTAVTGASLMLERKKFLSIGGFNEKLTIGGGDVDLCLRLNEKGYQTYYIGSRGYLIHHESMSRRNIPLPYQDFYYSYKSYIKHFDLKMGDKFTSYKIL